jgi:2'-5' RNA ligase
MVLWLVPSKQERARLEHFMKTRPTSAPLKDGSPSYPTFHPHITLLTLLTESRPHISLSKMIPHSSTATPVLFGDLRRGDTYLGAMQIVIDRTPELTRLHDDIERFLAEVHHIKSRSRNFPHLSLFYVDEEEERERLEKYLWDSRLVQKRADGQGVSLNFDLKDGTHVTMKEFSGEEIWLVDCSAYNANQWQVLERVSIAETMGGKGVNY